MRDLHLIHADVIDGLRQLQSGSCRTVVTSPPYWGLRDYGVAGQIGLEPTVDEWCSKLVEVFREVRRVLADDGTLWMNLGDCYAGLGTRGLQGSRRRAKVERDFPGLKPKDLVGQPWMLAFALRADGWYLRSDIVWSKPNPMPESVTDRPTRAHEYVFLLSKQRRYHYDAAAVMEPVTGNSHPRGNGVNPKAVHGWGVGDEPRTAVELNRTPKDTDGRSQRLGRSVGWRKQDAGQQVGGAVAGIVSQRNKRTVWEIPTQPSPEAHFATFPEALVRPCIRAGSARGDRVLDPFMGTGTVGVVCAQEGRLFAGVELSLDYFTIAARRLGGAGVQTQIW